MAEPQAPVALSSTDRVKSFLGWAFVLSIGLHLIFGPILGNYRPPRADKEETQKVSVSKKVKVVVPTPPPPTPTPPPPTPPPKSTPPPVKTTNPPPEQKLKLNVPKTTSKSSGASAVHQYVQPKVGSENGAPNGNAATGPVSTSPPATAPPAPPAPPTPAPTQKPSCANPNAPATTTRPVEPDYPEMARQQGAVGTVQVKVSLTAGGAVAGATVYKSSGNAALDNAAVLAAKQSSYAAEVDNCVPTAGTYLFRADFTGQ